MAIIPFYGPLRPDMFALERKAMDQPRLILRALDRIVPRTGRSLDIGAGDGFNAHMLCQTHRRIVALEPDVEMIDREKPLAWVRGDVESLPFLDDTFSCAYAAWAYFFPSLIDITEGYYEVHRVVQRGGLIVMLANIGGDEFTALAPGSITESPAFFQRLGFEMEVVDTVFQFKNRTEAQTLMEFYFGEPGKEGARKTLSYRVGIFTKYVT